MLNLHQISKTDPILLPILLKSIEDNRVFKKNEYCESFTKNINNLLSLRESRHSALLTLNLFCNHHSIANLPLISEKTCQELNWIDQLLKIIEQEPQYHPECFEIVGKLMRITSCNSDTNKIVQSKYVQKIIEAIVRSSVSPQHSLDCLATCFELHGGTSGIYKNKIYDYCVSFIDLPDDTIAERSALCLHLLQQSRGGSVSGGVYKKCWAEFHDRTIGSLEDILEEIMRKGGDGKIGKSEKLQLPDLKLSETYSRYTQLFVRFHNVITILRVSLQRPFSTPKIVQVSRILSFVEGGIAISQVLLGKKSISESMVLSLLHGQIHINLLNVLITIMKSLKHNVITNSKSICDTMWRCLKQTSSQEHLKFEANLKLRVVTYEAFITFMRISPNNFYLKAVMENLMKEALIDVTPANKEVYLMMPQQNSGKSNKKKKINLDKKFTEEISSISSATDEQKVCAKALECLGYLLVYQGTLMKPVLFWLLQEKILSIGFMISSKIQAGDLYRDQNCRLRLSDLVGFLMIYPVNKMPVPINYGVALLTKIKVSDPDSNVRDCAAMNLYRAETAIHNRKDVFYYPADYKDLRDTLMFNKQTINKFNESIAVHQEAPANGNHIEPVEANAIEESEAFLFPDKDTEDAQTGNAKSPQVISEEALEISDDEAEVAQEISDEEPIPEPVARTRSAEKKRNIKLIVESTVAVKKPKVSNKKDDGLVEELLADFNG